VFANLTSGDTAVINVDDPGSAPFAAEVRARGVSVCEVGIAGTRGDATVDGDMLVLTVHGERVPLVRIDELQIRGEHNVSNALAAAAAAHAIGASLPDIRNGLRSFEPIEHRLESVGVVSGVEYFNDSKATNPDAVLKALTAFDARPLVVLLGGHNKGNDFVELARAVSQRCKGAVIFGESAEEFARAFSEVSPPAFEVVRTASMIDAIAAAALMTVAGDVVALSPACASFDEFDDYQHRGRVFRDAVRLLSGEVTP